jgi:hypothetical protein
MIPEALLEDYQFWQNQDDSLTGYMKEELKASGTCAHYLRRDLLMVCLSRQNPDARARGVV